MTAIEALPVPAARIAANISQATAVEQARAVAEVAAAVRVAQDNPRNITRALDDMRQACRQKALAQHAFYSLPRAGGRIEGSTVHLARELAMCWGNVDHGIRELRRDDTEGVSEMQAWAWDQERNVRASRSFIVPHARMSKKNGVKQRERLDDLADIANNNNSVAARAVRETIFQVLPRWFRSEAEETAMQTLQDGGGKTVQQQIADAIAHFRDTWNVTAEQLEVRLERPSAKWTVQDLAVLRVISGELSRSEKRVTDEFPADEQRVTVADIAKQQQREPSGLDEFAPDTTQNPERPAQPRSARMISDRQRGKIMALIGDQDRDERLAELSGIVGRTVTSTNDLTADEAKVVIDDIERRVAAIAAERDDTLPIGGAE